MFAENEALRWLADLAGFPAGAGGVFVSGGIGRQPERARRRPLCLAAPAPAAATIRSAAPSLASAGAHSSVARRPG